MLISNENYVSLYIACHQEHFAYMNELEYPRYYNIDTIFHFPTSNQLQKPYNGHYP